MEIVEILVLLFGLFLCAVFVWFKIHTSQTEEIKKEYRPQLLKNIRTIGNHSYIPVNVEGCTQDDKIVFLILNILNDFEKQNPELEVTSWNIENMQWANGATARIFGLWVNHRPK